MRLSDLNLDRRIVNAAKDADVLDRPAAEFTYGNIAALLDHIEDLSTQRENMRRELSESAGRNIDLINERDELACDLHQRVQSVTAVLDAWRDDPAFDDPFMIRAALRAAIEDDPWGQELEDE